MSRSLHELNPDAHERALVVLDTAAAIDLDLLFYCTYRSPEEQAKLFRRGRTLAEIKAKSHELLTVFGRPDLATLLMEVGPQHGARVTNAGPGQSIHNYRGALDGVPLRDGQPVWSISADEDKDLWDAYGQIVQEAGFEWGGTWKFKDYPHIQLPDMNWRDLIKEGVL